MAWVILLLLPVMTFAKTCIDWETKVSIDSIKGNFFYEYQKDKVIKKNFANEFVAEITFPRKVDEILKYPSTEYGFFYLSDGKRYYYDLKAKKDVFVGNPQAQAKDSIDKKSITFKAPTDTSILFYETGKLVQIPPIVKTEERFGIIHYTQKDPDQKNSTMTLYDESGKEENLTFPSDATVKIQAPDVISIKKPGQELIEYKIKTATGWKTISHEPHLKIEASFPDGSYLVRNPSLDKKVSTQLINSDGKHVRSFHESLNASGPAITVENTVIAKDQFFEDIKSGKEPQFKVGNAYSGYGYQGDWKVEEESLDKRSLLNIKTKKRIPLSKEMGMFFNLNAKGSFTIVSGNNGTLIVDNEGKTKALPYTSSTYIFDDQGRTVSKYHPIIQSQKCVEVKIVEDDCNCTIKGIPDLDVKALDKLSLKSACSVEESEFDWKKYTPQVKNGEMSKQQAMVYLHYFQKPGAFDESYLPVLMGILSSDLVEKNSRDILEVMKSLDPQTMKRLFTAFNLDKRLTPTSTGTISCRTENEKPKNLAKMIHKEEGDFENYDGLLAYRYDFRELPKKEKDVAIDLIAENLSQMAAQENEDLSTVFASKLYYFSKKYVLGLLGEKFKPATDISISSDGQEQSIIILSSSPIKSEKGILTSARSSGPNPEYGFYYEVRQGIVVDESVRPGKKFSQKITWENADGKFSADVKTTIQKLSDEAVSIDKSPNYKAIKRDGQKTGLMLVGTNLMGNVALPDHYLTYYQNAGYTFEPAKNINAAKFLEDEISSGRLDYFIKEAHSDGDEKNIVRMGKQGVLLKGTKQLPDGTQGVMYLLAPASDTEESSVLVSNHTFGEWIRKRKDNSPMYYFNSSCSSSSKAVGEIAAAATRNLVNIPTATTAYTFSNNPGNAMNVMLTSFLAEKNYEAIRTDMTNKSPRYAKGEEDQFIFPDEERYQERIIAGLERHLDTKVQVKDSKGKVLHIDEQLDHD